MPRKRARTNVHATQSDDFLADVARAYYERHLTQEEVAVQFGVSRSQVSRYLQEAHARDIVQIRIVPAGARDAAAEEALKDAFPHLIEVVVARVFGDGPETVRWTVARAAARRKVLARPASIS